MEKYKKKINLNILLIGPSGSGKSTLLNHLIFKFGYINQKIIDKIKTNYPKIDNNSIIKYVLMHLDRERKFDIYQNNFETKNFIFTVYKTINLNNTLNLIVKRNTNIDLILFVNEIEIGSFEKIVPDCNKLVFILKFFEIKNMIVCINKLDFGSYSWCEDHYSNSKVEISYFLKKIGYNINEVPFIPISSWIGENLFKISQQMLWYNGLTLYESLEKIKIPSKCSKENKLRILIQEIYSKDDKNLLLVGKIVSGVLVQEMKLKFSQTDIISICIEIEKDGEKINELSVENNAAFIVNNIKKNEITRGCIVGGVDNPPTNCCCFFLARVYFLDDFEEFTEKSAILECNLNRVNCNFEKIYKKIDKKTEKIELVNQPIYVKKNDLCEIEIKTCKPISVELFHEFNELGKFLIKDSINKKIIAIGKILEKFI